VPVLSASAFLNPYSSRNSDGRPIMPPATREIYDPAAAVSVPGGAAAVTPDRVVVAGVRDRTAAVTPVPVEPTETDVVVNHIPSFVLGPRKSPA
jgi:hypothetical protein